MVNKLFPRMLTQVSEASIKIGVRLLQFENTNTTHQLLSRRGITHFIFCLSVSNRSLLFWDVGPDSYREEILGNLFIITGLFQCNLILHWCVHRVFTKMHRTIVFQYFDVLSQYADYEYYNNIWLFCVTHCISTFSFFLSHFSSLKIYQSIVFTTEYYHVF